ncbi:hypothetical protein PYCCODRAFT_1424214 [Trametes coccinea BRFM310]|uniref:Uncharacterized protein n=1 Tax=Trametes coccinea (strain BRFM310) TaxID=1353009 RepID=A0A1Y2IW26_TRAC3|nr:hypothetical protein PYCCODRAFT_1424214 [Trametes coccinea BRFM310]
MSHRSPSSYEVDPPPPYDSSPRPQPSQSTEDTPLLLGQTANKRRTARLGSAWLRIVLLPIGALLLATLLAQNVGLVPCPLNDVSAARKARWRGEWRLEEERHHREAEAWARERTAHGVALKAWEEERKIHDEERDAWHKQWEEDRKARDAEEEGWRKRREEEQKAHEAKREEWRRQREEEELHRLEVLRRSQGGGALPPTTTTTLSFPRLMHAVLPRGAYDHKVNIAIKEDSEGFPHDTNAYIVYEQR